MGAKKRVRKSRMRARKAVLGEKLFGMFEQLVEKQIFTELEAGRYPPLSAALAFDEGRLREWMLKQSTRRALFQRIARGWLATRRAGSPKRIKRVWQRDMGRFDRAARRVDALDYRRAHAEIRRAKRQAAREAREGYVRWTPQALGLISFAMGQYGAVHSTLAINAIRARALAP